MPHGETVATKYFRTIHKFQGEPAISKYLCQLVDLVIDQIQNRATDRALANLNDLKGYFTQVQVLLDDANNRSHKYLTEVMRLRRDKIELALDLASHLGDEAAKATLTEALAKMNEFVDASIADLDADS